MNSDDLKRPLPITGDTDSGTLGDEGLAAAARICASVYEPATVNALDSVYGLLYIDADKLDRLFRQFAERSNHALVPVMFDLAFGVPAVIDCSKEGLCFDLAAKAVACPEETGAARCTAYPAFHAGDRTAERFYKTHVTEWRDTLQAAPYHQTA